MVGAIEFQPPIELCDQEKSAKWSHGGHRPGTGSRAETRMVAKFEIVSKFEPAGDQPQAIEKLTAGYRDGRPGQVLMGVTGSGKTFTAANVIAQVGKPTLVLSHNKTLAAQLYKEFRGFFPKNAVHYFVSYYDYYQPEAY